jgi:hypothetical protein
MNRARWSGLVALVALVLSSAPAAQAAIVKPAPRVHTAAPTHRHAIHHHRHHPTAAITAARPVSQPAAPASPARPHGRHRATVPALTSGARPAPMARAGAGRAAVPAASGRLLTVDVRPLDLRQNAFPDAREHPVTGGRGPPRGSPHRAADDPSFPASSVVAPHAPPGAPAVSVSPRRRLTTPSRTHRPSASRIAPGGTSGSFVRFPGQPHGRLHAVRPEGATACVTMPSSGGSPCSAPHPSSRSGSRSAS